MFGDMSNAFATATKFTAPPMCRAINALAIFHASPPKTPIGTATYATNVPSVVPTAPTTKHGNNAADPRNTLRTSAVKSNIGTASGNNTPLMASYVGELTGMTPALAAAKAHNVETSGAPPRFAPHGFFSAHNPTAEAANMADHTPTTSVGAMSDAATMPRRRFVHTGVLCLRPARVFTTSRVVAFFALDAPVASRARAKRIKSIVVVDDVAVRARVRVPVAATCVEAKRVEKTVTIARAHSLAREQCLASNRRHRKRASSRA